MFTAVLDTNVLWPSLQRDFLLSLAVESLYRPIWSSTILDELVEHEALKRIKYGAQREPAERAAQRLVSAMDYSFDDSCVSGWEGLVGTYGLPDPDDEHVLAAAVVGGAGAIVTENRKDFPANLVPAGIDITPARQFALDTVSVSPSTAHTAVQKMVHRYRNPPATINEILDVLTERYNMGEAVALIRGAS